LITLCSKLEKKGGDRKLLIDKTILFPFSILWNIIESEEFPKQFKIVNSLMEEYNNPAPAKAEEAISLN